jgi:branched-chain amino acid aminotransferase
LTLNIEAQGIQVYIDGRRVSAADAKVSVFDRGLLYGDSVFETLATRGGRPFMLTEHVRRLRRSAELVYIDLALSDDQMCRELEEAALASSNSESYLRLIVTRGVGELGLDPSHSEGPCRILIVTSLQRPAAEAYENGVGAIVYRTQRTAEATEATGAKVGNYLVAVLAMRQAKTTGANEALIVNAAGRVVEGSTSNLFFRVGNVLRTPPVSAGILPGITRELVLEAAQALALTVQLHCPTPVELMQSDEVFITSSIREMLAVVTVDGVPIGDRLPGPTYRALWQAYQTLAAEKLAKQPRFSVPPGHLEK